MKVNLVISSQLLPASPCYTPSLGHSAAYRWPCSRPGKVSMILLLILQDWYQVPPGPKQEFKAVLATPQRTITLLQITSSHTPTPPLVDFSPSGNTAKVMSKLWQEEDHPRTQHSWLLILVSSLLSWVTLGRVHCLYEPHFSHAQKRLVSVSGHSVFWFLTSSWKYPSVLKIQPPGCPSWICQIWIF